MYIYVYISHVCVVSGIFFIWVSAYPLILPRLRARVRKMLTKVS